ncbi:unnamed protein product [Gadus morhua 'NCC']
MLNPYVALVVLPCCSLSCSCSVSTSSLWAVPPPLACPATCATPRGCRHAVLHKPRLASDISPTPHLRSVSPLLGLVLIAPTPGAPPCLRSVSLPLPSTIAHHHPSTLSPGATPRSTPRPSPRSAGHEGSPAEPAPPHIPAQPLASYPALPALRTQR